jgi:hypothetical protein
MAEALLPGTDAIPRNTAEFCSYRGKYLVRFRDAVTVMRRTFEDVDEASRYFWWCCRRLQDSARKG